MLLILSPYFYTHVHIVSVRSLIRKKCYLIIGRRITLIIKSCSIFDFYILLKRSCNRIISKRQFSQSVKKKIQLQFFSHQTTYIIWCMRHIVVVYSSICTCMGTGILLRVRMVTFLRISARLSELGIPSIATEMGMVLKRGWDWAFLRPWNGDIETASTDHWPPSLGAFTHVV